MTSKRPKTARFTDVNGREWEVFEFSIHAGKTTFFDTGSGSGQYRGFVPLDGGARRRRLMHEGEQTVVLSPSWLRDQLQLSKLDPRDDPKRTASPERVDPPKDASSGS